MQKRKKKQKHSEFEKQTFKSPPPKNKEDIENIEPIITD
jgi:hypothetical protein